MATQVKTGLIANDAITDAKIANVALTGVTASSGDSSTSLATTAFVATEINSLIDSAPGALNTLNELAAAMGDDANFSTTVTNSIATKLPLAGGTVTGTTTFTGGDGVAIQTSSNTFLQLKTTGSGSNYIEFKDSGGAAGNIRYNHSTNLLTIKTNGVDNRLAIDSTGDVGIGTDSPSQKLEVNGDIRIKDARSLFFNRNGDNYAWRIRNESAQDSTTYGFDGGNDLVFEVVSNSQVSAAPSATSHSIYNNSGNTLVLKETGYVGIGTQTPRTKLDVRGELSVDYNATYGLRFYNQPGNNWSSIGNTTTSSAANMVFKDSTGQVMELADGKIYIGTASNGSGQAVNAQNWIHANGLNLDIKGNDDVRFLGDAGTVIGRFTYQKRLAVGADAPVVPLDIQSSTFGLPNTSGTTANGMVRIGYINRTWGGNEVMLGIINDSSKGYAGYIQCKVPDNQAINRPLLLNPQGGSIGIGRDTVGKTLDVQTTGNTDGIRITGSSANTSLIIQSTGSGGNAWDISSTGAGHGYGEGALHFGVAFNPPKLILRGDGKIGMNLTTSHLPRTMLDVQTSNNSFVSVGIAPLAVGDYAGIHFGYKEDNTNYRKSAIVFKRTDKTSNDAQGQVHFLNGPQGNANSATLSDSKMIIHEGGQVTTGKNPAFRAYLSTERTTNGDFTSGWTDSGANSGVNAYDVNNDFNTSNGRFTAPVSGTYHFDLMWDSNASDAQISIFVVGTGHTGYLARWEPTGAANQGWESRAYSTDAYLEEGDYLYLVGTGASGTHPFHMGSAYWGFFSGHLVG